MKKLIASIILLAIVIFAGAASGGMLDANGQLRTSPYSLHDVTQHCEARGYFIYGGTIFMCVKIREGVSKEELAAYTKEDTKRQIAMRIKQQKRLQKWIQTEEGKVWMKDYQEKQQLDKSKE